MTVGSRGWQNNRVRSKAGGSDDELKRDLDTGSVYGTLGSVRECGTAMDMLAVLGIGISAGDD